MTRNRIVYLAVAGLILLGLCWSADTRGITLGTLIVIAGLWFALQCLELREAQKRDRRDGK